MQAKFIFKIFTLRLCFRLVSFNVSRNFVQLYKSTMKAVIGSLKNDEQRKNSRHAL